MYCLSDNDIDLNEETFIEFDHNSISTLDDHDDTNIEREPYIPQLKYTSPPKKPKKNGKLFLFFYLLYLWEIVSRLLHNLLYKFWDCFAQIVWRIKKHRKTITY